MANRLNAVPTSSAVADELRNIVARSHMARAEAAAEAERIQRQQIEDSREERKLRVSERRTPLRVSGVVGASGAPVERFVDPSDPATTIAEFERYQEPKPPELEWVNNPDGTRTLKPKSAGLTSAAPLPDYEWVTNPDGTRTMTRKREGLTSAPTPAAPRRDSINVLTLRDAEGNDVLVRMNVDTGQVEPVDTGGLSPRPTGTSTRPPTGAQTNARSFFERMREAIGELEATEDQLSSKDLYLINNSPAPEMINNALLSDAGQVYLRALRQYTEARLRKESGAAIPTSEYETDRLTVGRQVSDREQALANKRRSRRTTAIGIAAAAGPAYESYYGRPFDPDTVFDDAAAPPPPPGDVGSGTVVNIPGRGPVDFGTPEAAAAVRARLAGGG